MIEPARTAARTRRRGQRRIRQNGAGGSCPADAGGGVEPRQPDRRATKAFTVHSFATPKPRTTKTRALSLRGEIPASVLNWNPPDLRSPKLPSSRLSHRHTFAHLSSPEGVTDFFPIFLWFSVYCHTVTPVTPILGEARISAKNSRGVTRHTISDCFISLFYDLFIYWLGARQAIFLRLCLASRK